MVGACLESVVHKLKEDPFFDDFSLVKQSRLSVMPVTLKQWQKIIKMSSQ